jgi:nucleoside-diphosphate-sugar epimerase
MRVFVTGATGHIGSAVIPELLGAGHQVIGLARSDDGAAVLASMGADVCRGSLDDLDILGRAAADADGVIHLAFRHDAMQTGDMEGAARSDLSALETIAAALKGSGKPLVGTTGTALLARANLDRAGTESDTLPGGYRIDAENRIITLAGESVRSSVIRLAPTVHSSLDRHGFVPGLIAIARRRGMAAYIGDGANRWPAVHTLDAASLYRRALESAPSGTRLHAVAEEGVPFRLIAEAIGRRLNIPTISLDEDQAGDYFTYLAPFAGIDNPTSSAHTRTLMQWSPTHPGLIEDLNEEHYFKAERL